MAAKNPRAYALNRYRKLQDGTELFAEANGHDVLEELHEEFSFLPAREDEFDLLADSKEKDPYDYDDEPYDDVESLDDRWELERLFLHDHLFDPFDRFFAPLSFGPRPYVHLD